LEIRDKKGAENVVADNLSRLKLDGEELDEIPIDEFFLDEQLFSLVAKLPWYADFVNYLSYGVLPLGMTWQQKKKFLHEVKFYRWDDPLLFRRCCEGLIRRCIPEEETQSILHHCHASDYGGHFGISKTASKILQAGFFWPNLFKDVRKFVLECDKCQRSGNLSKRDQMPLNDILEVELFDV